MGQDEGELAHAVRGERGGIEVLDDEDAVAHVQHLRNLEGPRRVLSRHRAVAPGVAPGKRNAAPDEPFGDLVAGPGLAGEVCLGVVPVLTPARVEENRVARLGLDAIEILDRGDAADAEPALGDIDYPSTGNYLGKCLGAQPFHPG